jgi:mannose-1-phosphate guanylyltransferase
MSVLIPLVLSGGAGTRLWPVSREAAPKPFMPLPDGQSLLQKTALRAAALPGVQTLLTVTNRDYYFRSKDEYAHVEAGLPRTRTFLLEPFGRNTAPAVALGALYAAERHGNDTVLLVLPADHLIHDQAAFAASVADGIRIAQSGRLVTFGIVPTRPETGFGYVECGDTIAGLPGHNVERFVEKPSLMRAEEYVASGRFLWNSGMFCFTAGCLLDACTAHAPDVLAAVRATWKALGGLAAGDEMLEIEPAVFESMPDISIDYAVMERASNVAVVPASFGWSDIGSWGAVSELTPADSAGNRVLGETVIVDSYDTYIHAENRLVATVGVDGLVIVDTPDALLVANRHRLQEVKDIVAQLKARGHEAYKLHRTVVRPWGSYTVLQEGEGFKIKRIEVKPKQALSLQMHHHRSEHWVVVSGMARVVNGLHDLTLNANESTFIPAGHQHRLVNEGSEMLVLIEVQCGSYVGEDDIVRFDDQYGRVPAPSA